MISQRSSESRFNGELPLRTSSLQEFDWHNATDRQVLRRTFQNLREHPETITHLQPFVIRGGAASWRACMRDSKGWTVDELVRRGGGLRGLVRAAPTLQFPYVMPAHADELARLAATDAVVPSATRQVRRNITHHRLLRVRVAVRRHASSLRLAPMHRSKSYSYLVFKYKVGRARRGKLSMTTEV